MIYLYTFEEYESIIENEEELLFNNDTETIVGAIDSYILLF